MMVAVSFIVPVYNKRQTLKRCLDSVLAQSCRDFEAIIVDDGSMDGSDAICREYEALDSRVTYERVKNGGVSRARNIGLSKSNGQYVVFVDADDWIDGDFLLRMIDFVSRNKLDWAACNVASTLESGDVYRCGADFICTREDARRLNVDTSVVWGKIFRRDFIESQGLGFNERMVVSEDSLFMTQALVLADRIGHCGSYVGYHYEPDANGLMQSKRGKYFDSVLIGIQDVLKLNRENGGCISICEGWIGTLARYMPNDRYDEFVKCCRLIRQELGKIEFPSGMSLSFRIRPRFLVVWSARAGISPGLVYLFVKLLCCLKGLCKTRGLHSVL